MTRSTLSRRARNSLSVTTGRRRPASRPSRRRCFLASRRVEPLTRVGSLLSTGSGRGWRTRTTVLGASSPGRGSSPGRRRERRRTVPPSSGRPVGGCCHGCCLPRGARTGGSGGRSGAWKSSDVVGRRRRLLLGLAPATSPSSRAASAASRTPASASSAALRSRLSRSARLRLGASRARPWSSPASRAGAFASAGASTGSPRGIRRLGRGFALASRTDDRASSGSRHCFRSFTIAGVLLARVGNRATHRVLSRALSLRTCFTGRPLLILQVLHRALVLSGLDCSRCSRVLSPHCCHIRNWLSDSARYVSIGDASPVKPVLASCRARLD